MEDEDMTIANASPDFVGLANGFHDDLEDILEDGVLYF
jgi:hypothetical protein